MNTKDGNSTVMGIESNARQEIEKRKASINWKLILLLSGLGPMTAIVFRQDFTRALPTWVGFTVCLLVIPISCAGWITKKIVSRHFLHGFLVGFLWLFGSIFTTIVSTSRAGSKVTDGLVFVLLGIPSFGSYVGFFTWVAGKIARKRSHHDQSRHTTFHAPMPGGASGRAIWAVVLSVAGIFLCGTPFLSVPGLILGKVEMNSIRDGEAPAKGKNFAKVGFYLGLAQTAFYGGFFVFAAIGWLIELWTKP